MLDSLSPDMPETIRYLSQTENDDIGGGSRSLVPPPPSRRLRNRKMREKRTAYAMMAFGLLLGVLELYIVLSYF
jgi:hypothetical protein